MWIEIFQIGLALFIGSFLYSFVTAIIEMKQRNLTGPLYIPYFGYILRILVRNFVYKNDNMAMMSAQFSQHNTIFVRTPGACLFITKDPDVIKYSTKEGFNNFQRLDQSNDSIQFQVAKALFGNGIFMADGSDWRIQRTVASPLFKRHSLSNMRDVFEEKAKIFLEILHNTAEKGESVDLQKLFYQYTLDSFGKIGFGIEINSLTTKIEFPVHFDSVQQYISQAFQNPIYFRFSQAQKLFYESNEFIQNFFVQAMSSHSRDGDDLLSQFSKLTDENGKPFPESWLKEILVNFTVAGRDTTAILMTWMIYCIVSNERVYEEVRKEIERVLINDDFSEKNLNEMKYMNNVIKETLRLYPSVPLVNRFASQDCTLPNGQLMKRGDRLLYLSIFVHRDPILFPNPLEFIPERWDETSSYYHPIHHTHAYIPFHAGEMQCLGRHMAAIEAKLLVSKLLKYFSFSLLPGRSYAPFINFVMPIASGLHVNVSRI